ncbi:hypothetical protein ACEXQE_01025 [Herbiconiux sp. P17]|uniref:hypothetical protein n=1 Tax=Herbiconiux wuyangfengii TaxID=3342794 RepID=UPI0035B787AA
MTALDATPSGIDLLAIRVGSTLERWGRERAARQATRPDPAADRRLRAEVESARARADALLMRIR